MDKLDIMRTIKERGLLAKDIAKKMGITNIAMSQSVNGNPKLETLRNIAEAIGCNMRDFFYPEDEEKEVKEGLFAQEYENADTKEKKQTEHKYQAAIQSTAICPHCGARFRAGVVLMEE